MTGRKLKAFALTILCLVFSSAFAVNDSPQTFTLDGQLFKVGTTNPLLDANAEIVVQILSSDAKCILYEEHQFVDTSASAGYFNIQVGSDTSSTKRTSNDKTHTMAQVFQNLSAITGNNAAGQTCAGGAYQPLAGDARLFRLIVTPSATHVADTLTPDMTLDSVPNAIVAETVQGLDRSGILQVNNGGGVALTQPALEAMFTNPAYGNLQKVMAGNFMQSTSNGAPLPVFSSNPGAPVAGDVWYDSVANVMKYYDGTVVKTVSAAGTSVTGITAGLGLLGGTITSSGTIAVDVGTGANKIVQFTSTGKYPAVDGSLITNISAITALTGDVTAAGPGSATATIANNAITSAKIASAGGGTSRILITDPTTGSSVGYASCVTAGEVLQWTPSGWACATVSSFLGASGVTAGTYGNATQVARVTVDSQGRVTALTNVNINFPVTSVNGKTGGAITLNGSDLGLGTASTQDYGTAANQLLPLNGSAQIPAVDGSLVTNVNAVKLTGRTVSSTAPVGGQVLAWNSATSVWEPGSVTSGTVTNVTGGSGLLGGTINSVGTLSVDTGTTANKIVQLDSNAKIPAVDGSQVTNINATRVGTRTVSTAAPVTGQVMTWNGTSSQWEPMATSAVGVTNVTAGSGLLGGVINSTGTLSVDTGTAANKIVQLDSNAKIPAVDGSQVTNVNASKIGTRTISSATPAGGQAVIWNSTSAQWEPTSITNGTVTSVVAGTALLGGTINGVGTLSVDVGTGANQVLQLNSASKVPAVDGYLMTNMNAANLRGRPLSNATPASGQFIGWNGTTAQWEPITGAGGSVTSVVGGAGLLGGNISGVGTLSVDTGTTANKIVQLDSAAKLPAVDGSQVTNTNATRIGTRTVSSTAPAAGQVMTWNNTSSQWEPMATAAVGVTNVTAGSGLTGGVINSVGTLAVDTGTTANKIVQLDSSAKLPVVDGSQLTNVNASKIGTRTISSATPAGGQAVIWNSTSAQWEPTSITNGTVTSVVAGTALLGGTINGVGTLSVDVGTGANQVLQLNSASKVPAVDGYLMTNMNAANLRGRPLSSATPASGQFIGWNGTTAQWEPITGAGGSVTSVVGGAGLLGGNISGVGTLTVDTGTTANKIVQLDSSAKLPAVDGSQLTNVNASKIGTRTISSATPASGQVISWNSTTSAWEPTALASTANNWLNGGNSFGGNATIGTNDNNSVTFLTNTAARMIIDNAGNVGIGTTSPSVKLQVTGGTPLSLTKGSGYFQIADDGAAQINMAFGWDSIQVRNGAGAVQFFRLNPYGGFVGIGTLTPLAPLDVLGTIRTDTICDRTGANCKTIAGGWGAGGSVTNVTGGAGLLGGSIGTAGTLSVDVGTTANKILQLDTNAKIPAVDGFLVTNVNAVKLQARNVSSATPAALQVLRWNGTTSVWEPSNDTTGTVTSITAGTGLTGGVINSNGTIAVDVGTTANKIVQLDNNAKIPAVDGSQVTNLNATRIGTRTIATSVPATGQVITWNGTTSQWEPQAIGVATTAWVNGGNSFGANATLGTNDAKTLSLLTNGTARIVVDASGNVGIGTSSPMSLIQVGSGFGVQQGGDIALLGNMFWDTANSRWSFTGYSGGTPAYSSGFLFHPGGGMYGLVSTNSGTAGQAATTIQPFFISQTGLFTMNYGLNVTSGNVGIGTATPGSPLDVVGTIRTDTICDRTGANCKTISGGWGAGGSVTNVTGGAGLLGGSIGTFGTLSVDVGTTANKILQLDNNAKIPAVDGFLVTNVNAVKLQARNVSSATPAGAQVLRWNGTTLVWEPSNDTSGTVTNITASTGLTGGVINSTGTIAVDVGTTANKILQLDSNAKIPAVDGYQVTNLNATRIGTRTIATSTPATGQVITWNGTTSQWEPQAIGVATTAWVNGGNSFGANATLGTNDNKSISFLTNSSARMVIDASGNVGIGTTTPGAPLQVEGSDSNEEIHIVNSSSSTNRWPALWIKNYSGGFPYGSGALNLLTSRGSKASPVAVQQNDALSVWSTWGQTGNSVGNYSVATQISTLADGNFSATSSPGSITFSTTPSGSTTVSERMRVTSSGYVGVGTSTPGAPLDVVGTIRTDVICDRSGGNCKTISGGWGAGGSVTNVTGGAGLLGGSIGTYGTLSVDVGTAANKIMQLTNNAQIPAVDGFLVTNVNAVKLQARNVSSATPAGAQVLRWNGTTLVWEPSNDTSGTVTNITASTGLTGGVINSTGTIAVDVGTAANKILQLDSNAKIPAVDGYQVTNLNATRIGTRTIATSTPATGQVITWNGTTSQWEPQAIGVATTAWVNGGNSFGANATLGTNDSKTLSILTNASTRVLIDVAGNVGIGTTPVATWAPGYSILQVGAVGSLRSGAAGTSTVLANNQYWDGTNDRYINAGSASQMRQSATGQFDFFVTGAGAAGGIISFVDAMTITSTGNVGIGTVTPQKPLDVTGAGAFGTSNFPASAYVQGNLFVSANTAGPPANSGITQTNLGSRLTNPGGATLDVGVYTNGNFWQQVTNVSNLANSYALVLNPNGGNVGIGSSSPTYKLDVAGNINATAISINGVAVGTGGTQWTTAGANIGYTAGNVGIGTTSPTQKLQVGDGTGTSTQIKISDSISNMFIGTNGGVNLGYTAGNIAVVSNTGSHPFGFVNFAAQPLLFGTSNVENMRIMPGGNVGIGTTTPGAPLDVVGTIRTDTICDRAGANCKTVTSGWGVTNVTGGTGLLGGSIGTTGTLSVDVGTTANKILQLDSNAKIPAVDGFLVSNINAVKLQGKNVSSATPAGGQLLGWNATTSAWEPTAVTGVSFPLTGPNGSASAPTYSFSTDPNSGMLLSSTGKLGFSIASSVVLNVDSANIYSPTNWGGRMRLNGVSTAASPVFSFTNDPDTGMFEADTTSGNALGFSTGGGERMRIDASGNVGIGTLTPGQKLSVNGTIESLSGGIKFPDGTIQATSAYGGGSNNTLISGYPDFILCNSGAGSIVMALAYAPFAAGPTYSYLASPSSTSITYTGAGNYSTSVGLAGYDCLTSTLSLTQLYGLGHAFNIAKGPAAQWLQSGTSAYYNAGNVGIGTSSPMALLDLYGTGTLNSAMIVPRDTVANRPTSAVAGMIRYASDTNQFEAYANGSWQTISTSGGTPTFTGDLTLSGAGTGLTVTNTEKIGGNLTVTGSTVLNGGLSITGNVSSSGAMTVAAGGTNKDLTLAGSGSGFVLLNPKVGIGTSSPANALHVYDPAASTITVEGGATGTPSRRGIFEAKSDSNYRAHGMVLTNPSGSWFAGNPYSITGGGYMIGYNATQPEYPANALFFINPNGNVGIGTVSANYLLHVKKDQNANTELTVDNSGTGTLSRSTVRLVNDVSSAGLTYRNSTNSASARNLEMFTNDASANINFYPGNNLLTMSLTNTGNVGIGTASPTGLFDVYATTSSIHSLVVNGTTGYVGVGTTNPLAKFNVMNAGVAASTEYLLARFEENSVRGVAIGYLANSAGNAVQESRIRSIGSVPLVLGTSAYNQAVSILDTNGNVGVGTTTPQALLDVYGLGTLKSAMIVPRDTVANRPTIAVAGMIRYASDTNQFEAYANGNWQTLSTSGGTAAFTGDITLSGAGTGLTVTNTENIGGNLTVTGSTVLNGGLNMNSQNITNVGAGIIGSGAMSVSAGGTNQNLVLSGSGTGQVLLNPNVGINTTSAQTTLTVYGTSGAGNNYLSLYIKGQSTNSANGLRIEKNSSGGAATLQTFFGGTYLSENVYEQNVGGTGTIYDTTNPASQVMLKSGEIHLRTITSGTAAATVGAGAINDALIVANNGNVGIGTATPAQILDLYSTSTLGTQLRIDNGDTGGHNWAAISTASGNTMGAGKFVISDITAGASRMTIDTSGNVGIGYTNPYVRLMVNGVDENATSWPFNSYYYDDVTAMGIGAGGGIGFGGRTDAGTTIAMFGGIHGGKENATTSNNDGFLSLHTRLGASQNERMRISSTGNVGIGTTSNYNGAKFHINAASGGQPTVFLTNNDFVGGSAGSGVIMSTGASSGTTYGQIYSFTTGNSAYGNLVVPGGNVGIGTLTPGNLLSLVNSSSTVYVGGNLSALIGIKNPDTTNGNGVALSLQSVDAAGTTFSGSRLVSVFTSHATNAGSSDLAFETVNANSLTEKMRITASGNVGIGTSSPSRPLHVYGPGGGSPPTILIDQGAGGADLKRHYISAGTAGTFLFGKMSDDLTVSTEQMRIDTNGQVGIGTTAPLVQLTVSDNPNGIQAIAAITGAPSGTAGMFVGADSAKARIIVDSYASSATMGSFVTLRSARGTSVTPTATQNGDVIGGVTAEGYSATSYGQSTPLIQGVATESYTNSANGVAVVFDTTPNGSTAYAERMRIDHNGNVGIGTTLPAYKLDVRGGQVAGAGAFVNTSDVRLKKDIVPITYGLNSVMEMRPVEFNWKDQSEKWAQQHQVGFIAQEVEKVVPEVVSTADDPEHMKSIAYGALTPVLVRAIQEIRHMLDSMMEALGVHTREIASLKNADEEKDKRINKLEIENQQLKAYLCAKDPQAPICK